MRGPGAAEGNAAARDDDRRLIDRLAALVPKGLEARSGKEFCGGRAVCGPPCPIYLQGLEPGGHGEDDPEETIGEHTWRVLEEWLPGWRCGGPDGKCHRAAGSPLGAGSDTS
jgi:hypothetical protein